MNSEVVGIGLTDLLKTGGQLPPCHTTPSAGVPELIKKIKRELIRDYCAFVSVSIMKNQTFDDVAK